MTLLSEALLFSCIVDPKARMRVIHRVKRFPASIERCNVRDLGQAGVKGRVYIRKDTHNETHELMGGEHYVHLNVTDREDG